jgi:hypothetical protein
MNQFSLQTVLWLRFIYVISVIPATFLLAFLPLPPKLLSASRRTFDVLYLTLFISTRFLVFGLIFFALHVGPRGDVVGYYYPEANRTLHGALVYRDFVSSYAPLFSYIGAGVLWVKNTPLALIVFTILIDICSIPIWFAAIRSYCPEPAFRRGALLYLAQPLMLFNVAVDGGNNVWIALSLALALLCFAQRRDVASGASYSISLIAVKFLPLIFAPLLFLSARRRLAWTAGFLLPMLTVFGLFAAKHANVLLPLQEEGSLQLGGSLPLLFSDLTGINIPGHISDAITVFVLLACTFVWWHITFRSPSHRLTVLAEDHETAHSWKTGLGLLVLTLSMLMFSKKSWSIYIIMVMFLLCQLVARHGPLTRFIYCIFSFLLIVEPSFLFAKVGNQHQPIHVLLMQGDSNAWLLIAMYIVELVCSAWFIHVATSDLRHPPISHQAAL